MLLVELETARRDLTRLSRRLTEARSVGKRSCSNCKRMVDLDGFYSRRKSWCKKCDNKSRVERCRRVRVEQPEVHAKRLELDNARRRAAWARLKAEDPEGYERKRRRIREREAQRREAGR